ncbi:papain-like cysteine protease family protein [Roseateles sp. LYH14W]|uniref:Papain-like cysteine protease family protein n=1 Tax=Pelomonas parva TaxID=3299032 RepID=A0ABW7F9F3_9BURK
MKRRVIGSIAAAAALLAAGGVHWLRRKDRLGPDIVRHAVPVLRQTGPMNCWAAVYAMLLSWKLSRTLTEQQAVAALGEPWAGLQRAGSGLPGGQELRFVAAAGLVAEPPASYMLEAFLDWLKFAGPIWVSTGDGLSSHARLLIGAVGDGKFDSTKFIVIDPATAMESYEPLRTFFDDFEHEARAIVAAKTQVDLRWQIIHWPPER